MRQPMLLLILLATGCGDSCSKAPPPPVPTAASTTASPTQPARNPEQIQAEIDRIEKELEALNKKAARTFSQQTAKKINEQITQRKARLEKLKTELEEAE